ncbi:hypothetical protein J5O08_20425, partial [Cellulomonas sp. PS-H5]|nr:hypothetical protein [Cellulomonas sp. PS-H5]
AGAGAGAGAGVGAGAGAGSSARTGGRAPTPPPWRVRPAGGRGAETPEGALAGALLGAVQPALF